MPLDFVLTEADYVFYTKVLTGNFLNYEAPASAAVAIPATNQVPVPAPTPGSLDSSQELDLNVTVESIGLLIKKQTGRLDTDPIAAFKIINMGVSYQSFTTNYYVCTLPS